MRRNSDMFDRIDSWEKKIETINKDNTTISEIR